MRDFLEGPHWAARAHRPCYVILKHKPDKSWRPAKRYRVAAKCWALQLDNALALSTDECSLAYLVQPQALSERAGPGARTREPVFDPGGGQGNDASGQPAEAESGEELGEEGPRDPND